MIALLGTPCSGLTTIKLLLIEIYGVEIIDGKKFSSSELLEFVTPKWNCNFCLINVEAHWKTLVKRPFICFIFVDSSIEIRLQRYKTKFQSHIGFYNSLIQPGSEDYFNMISASHVKLINDFDTVYQLREHIQKINVVKPDLVRPNWDTYFMRLARLASKRSNCMKRQVGCVIVYNNRIVSTGYNGTPSGIKNCKDGGCSRCNMNSPSGVHLDTCLCIHAEDNALLEAGKPRLPQQSKLYCTLFPCVSCSKKIVQMGIAEIIYDIDYNQELRSLSMSMFNEAKMIVKKLNEYDTTQVVDK